MVQKNSHFSFIKNLVEAAETFSNETGGSDDLAAFAQWLHLRVGTAARTPQHPEIGVGEHLDSVIGKLIVYLNRYAKAYSKKALANSPLGSTDEFVFLICLEMRGNLSKMELIQLNRLEKSAGMEILRRLTAAGWVTEQPNETDKRSKQLSLTPAGRQVLFSVFQPMDEVSHLITGNLTLDEKHQLLRLLLKLEDFHAPLQHALRRVSWEHLLLDATADKKTHPMT